VLTPLLVPKRLKKKLRNKPEQMQRGILACLKQLRKDPRHPGLRTKKMTGRRGDIFESRATKGNRITWFWQGSMIVIEDHCKHDVVEGR
jgi:hypothetical protein